LKIERIHDAVLYNCDCREILPTLGKVDAVVTDPPYGVNLGSHRGANDTRSTVLTKAGYASYDDTPESFKAVVAPAIEQSLAIATRGAVFMAGKSAWMLPPADSIGGIYLPSGMGRNSWGFASLQHCLFYGTAPDLHKGAKATAIYSTETSEKNGHPCPKPLGWMMWTVSLASRRNETIIDPFMGSGTTGVACAKLGRKFIGIEIEPKYFDIACRRIEAAYKQPDLFIEKPAPAKQEAML
jgi:site-specific DNA-methyltransferase (adenine-specific)